MKAIIIQRDQPIGKPILKDEKVGEENENPTKLYLERTIKGIGRVFAEGC